MGIREAIGRNVRRSAGFKSVDATLAAGPFEVPFKTSPRPIQFVLVIVLVIESGQADVAPGLCAGRVLDPDT
jgi:hypothetical protein